MPVGCTGTIFGLILALYAGTGIPLFDTMAVRGVVSEKFDPFGMDFEPVRRPIEEGCLPCHVFGFSSDLILISDALILASGEAIFLLGDPILIKIKFHSSQRPDFVDYYNSLFGYSKRKIA